MNPGNTRRIASEALIGTAACAALYFVVVDPMQSRLAGVRAELDRQSTHAASSLSLPVLQAKASKAKEFLSEIRDNSALSTSELDVFAMLMRHAERAGAQVEQLQQRSLPEVQEMSDPADETPVHDQRLGFSMNVVGTVAQIVSLLQLMNTQSGYTTIDSVQLTPTGTTENPLVIAAIETTHWSFDTSAAVQAFAQLEQSSGENP